MEEPTYRNEIPTVLAISPMIVVRNFTDDGDYGFITDELLMGRG
jgi:hypothetical protein